MCIIIDANKLSSFLADPPDEDSAPVRKWLDKGGILVYSTGSIFAEEVTKRAKRKLTDYVRAGQAKVIPGEQFTDDESSLRTQRGLRSNDPHVLALARVSGARLLYTGDNDLIADFKNKQFIDKPRGKVYSGSANANLLTRSACEGRGMQ